MRQRGRPMRFGLRATFRTSRGSGFYRVIFWKKRWAIDRDGGGASLSAHPIASMGAKQSCSLGPISVVASLWAQKMTAWPQGTGHDKSPELYDRLSAPTGICNRLPADCGNRPVGL